MKKLILLPCFLWVLLTTSYAQTALSGSQQQRDPHLTTPFHSFTDAESFKKAWDDAKEAGSQTRLRNWVTPDFSRKLVQSRGKRYFSDLEAPTADLDGMLCKYVLYDINDQPLGEPVYLKISGFTGSNPPLKTVGFTLVLAPGGVTSSAEIWLVAGKQRATTGKFKL